MTSLDLALAVLVAAAASAIDYALVRHQEAVRERRPHRAGRWSVAAFAAGAVGLVSAVQVGWWLLAPQAAGYYAGTWLAVERLRRGR